MESLSAATHHVVISSIGSSSVSKLFSQLQSQLPNDSQSQMIDDTVIIITIFDVRVSKLLFDALSLILGRERFALSYCDSVRFNIINNVKHCSTGLFFSSMIVYHNFKHNILDILKESLLSLGDIREFEFLQGKSDIHLFFVEFYDARVAVRARELLQQLDGVLEVNPTDESHNSYFHVKPITAASPDSKDYVASWKESDTLKLVSGIYLIDIPDFTKVATILKTTFMIKNIPNKYTQKLLVEQLNKTHYGQFDFLYLRIDFKNHCNVGYAFINFVNIGAILSFIEIYVGKLWPHFNSEKQCDIAYARVQGRQALIEKFKHSCVMDQDPTYRPKLYYTVGERKGTEEVFPSPSSSITI